MAMITGWMDEICNKCHPYGKFTLSKSTKTSDATQLGEWNQLITKSGISIGVRLVDFQYKKEKSKSSKTFYFRGPQQWETIVRYAKSLRDLWIRSFTEKFVITYKSIHKRLENISNDYYKRVYLPAHEQVNLSFCQRNKLRADMEAKDVKRIHTNIQLVVKNSDLLDIGKNQDMLTGDERIFYLDQRGIENIC